MHALLSVQRIRHDDQLLFVGGWHLDDGALYENAATLRHIAGPPVIWPVSRSAPVLHLVEAADASNEVKFEAGAELSKAVN